MTAGTHDWLHVAQARPGNAGRRYARPRYARIVVGIVSAIGALLALGMFDSAVSGLR